MKIWSGIKTMLGSKDNVETIVETAANGLYNGIDKLVYTDEEKADAFSKAREWYLKFVDRAYDENSIRSVTRRWLAWSVTAWILTNAQVAIIFAILEDKPIVDNIINIAGQFKLGWAFVTILIFYFGVHTVRALTNGKKT